MSENTERRTPRLSGTKYALNMDHHDLIDGRVQFTSEEDPRVVPSLALRLDAAEWNALGSPDVITVTVEPGDLLNDEKPSRSGARGAGRAQAAAQRALDEQNGSTR